MEWFENEDIRLSTYEIGRCELVRRGVAVIKGGREGGLVATAPEGGDMADGEAVMVAIIAHPKQGPGRHKVTEQELELWEMRALRSISTQRRACKHETNVGG